MDITIFLPSDINDHLAISAVGVWLPPQRETILLHVITLHCEMPPDVADVRLATQSASDYILQIKKITSLYTSRLFTRMILVLGTNTNQFQSTKDRY
jgi:hypothetical protein